jgi:hypothetical protein
MYVFEDHYIEQCYTLSSTQMSHALEHRFLGFTTPQNQDSKALLYTAAQVTLMLIHFPMFRAFDVHSTTLRTLLARLISALILLEASLIDTLDFPQSGMLW